MANEFTMRTVGNWSQKMAVPLSDALKVSKDLFRRSGPDACKHAVILMAQSARAMTPQAKKNRKVMSDSRGKYVQYDRPGKNPAKVYKWMFNRGESVSSRHGDFKGTWEGAKRIQNRGLAKRSWMWQLEARRKPISGASLVAFTKEGTEQVGYVKHNKLDYILKIMPAGWLAAVTQKATNKIMAQAGRKLGKQFQRALTKVKRAA